MASVTGSSVLEREAKIGSQDGCCLDWGELLKEENGGPGDCPGREIAVKEAIELYQKKKKKKETKGKKKKKR